MFSTFSTKTRPCGTSPARRFRLTRFGATATRSRRTSPSSTRARLAMATFGPGPRSATTPAARRLRGLRRGSRPGLALRCIGTCSGSRAAGRRRRCCSLHQPVDGAIERGDVDAAVRALTEGRNEGNGKPLGPVATGLREPELYRTQLADAEVHIQVAAVEGTEGPVTNHVTAG